jgi:hypothetical protein
VRAALLSPTPCCAGPPHTRHPLRCADTPPGLTALRQRAAWASPPAHRPAQSVAAPPVLLPCRAVPTSESPSVQPPLLATPCCPAPAAAGSYQTDAPRCTVQDGLGCQNVLSGGSNRAFNRSINGSVNRSVVRSPNGSGRRPPCLCAHRRPPPLKCRFGCQGMSAAHRCTPLDSRCCLMRSPSSTRR